jgi:hypothetical protein
MSFNAYLIIKESKELETLIKTIEIEFLKINGIFRAMAELINPFDLLLESKIYEMSAKDIIILKAKKEDIFARLEGIKRSLNTLKDKIDKKSPYNKNSLNKLIENSEINIEQIHTQLRDENWISKKQSPHSGYFEIQIAYLEFIEVVKKLFLLVKNLALKDSDTIIQIPKPIRFIKIEPHLSSNKITFEFWKP